MRLLPRLLLCAACSAETQGFDCAQGLSIYVEPNPAVDVATIAWKAGTYWSNYMACPVEVRSSLPADILVTWGDAGSHSAAYDRDAMTITIGRQPWHDLGNCSITMLANTLAHELGHAFGYGHSGNPQAMMYDGGQIWCRDKMYPVPAPIR